MGDEGTGGPGREEGRSAFPVVVAVVWVAASIAAFTWLDPVLAAFASIIGLTLVGVAFASSSGWVRSTSYEERELERARRRKAKWEAKADVRERDRVRWEAHQARRARPPDS